MVNCWKDTVGLELSNKSDEASGVINADSTKKETVNAAILINSTLSKFCYKNSKYLLFQITKLVLEILVFAE